MLSETADFVYKCTNYYDAATEKGIRFDDPDVGVELARRHRAALLRARRDAPRLAEIADTLPFRYDG